MHTSHLPDPHLDAQFYAGVPIKRLFAWAIDAVLIFLLAIVAVILTFGLGFFFLVPLAFVINLGYRIASLALWSATPGMRVMGIEIRNKDGERVDNQDALFHSGLYVLITLTGLGVPATALSMLISERGQGLHDLVLGTTAINRPLD